MNFTLTYEGPLKSNGNKKHKQEIRRVFHSQLRELWKGSPFAELKSPLEDSLVSIVGTFRFFSLVSAGRNEIAELQILMLRSGQDSGHIVQGGDIDNRLKTLFDSLRIPKNKDEIPQNDLPNNDENPFFCLLEDDILITDLSVATDRLLEARKSPSHVKLVIRVQIKTVPKIGANMIITCA